MIRIRRPDDEFQHVVKHAAIDRLIELGFAKPCERRRLAALHPDDVLDRVFLHCSILRVRLDDDRVIEIHPGNRSLH